MAFLLIGFIPLLCCCSSSMVALAYFGPRTIGQEDTNIIWASMSSSSCALFILCIIMMIGTFWVTERTVTTVL